MFPWASFGGFLFLREETAHFGSDAGWIPSATYIRQRPLGSARDYIITTSIGSDERSFELNFRPDRLDAFKALLNTVAVFTDWTSPVPDSRSAFLSEVTPLEFLINSNRRNGFTSRVVRTRVALISQ